MLASFTASYQHLLWTPNSIGVPEGPLVGCGFPYHIQLFGTLLATPLAHRTQLNYIIIRRPLDLWNRMFNRHQAEITVMQFRGHSFPVHQSMSVLWEFFSLSYFISQFPPTQFPHITAIGMCHFLPVHHLEWHFARAEGQNITLAIHTLLPLVLQWLDPIGQKGDQLQIWHHMNFSDCLCNLSLRAIFFCLLENKTNILYKHYLSHVLFTRRKSVAVTAIMQKPKCLWLLGHWHYIKQTRILKDCLYG